MKYSGIEWIGNVPDNWSVERLQLHLDEIKESNNPVKTTQVLSLTNKLGVIPYEEKGDHGNKAKENCDEYKLAYPGTIVANSMNILIGSVGKCDYFGCVSPVYYIFKPKENNNLEFLNYVFQMETFQKELRKYANGILEIRLRVSASDILKRKVAVPPFDEQTKIVNVLNEKCSQIDKLIEVENSQIEKLYEFKKSIIDELTIGELSTKATKKVNLSWIHKIPNDWEAMPIKTMFDFAKGLPITKDDLLNEGIKVISYGQLHSKDNVSVCINDSLYRYVSKKYLNSNKECMVKMNDLIMSDTSEDLEGTCDFVRIDKNDEIFAGYHSIIFKNKMKGDTKFISYLFQSDFWRMQFRSRVNGVKLFSLTQKLLSQGTLVLPPKEEQIKICNALDNYCSSISKLIDIKKEKIDKLSEYKKTLVYEYVTGKKEVVA